MEFAHLAREYTRWAKEAEENVVVSHFGFTLEEVEARGPQLAKENAEFNEKSATKQKGCKDVHAQGVALGVKDNEYTKLSLDDLANSGKSLSNAIAQRDQKYQTELARQRANDKLCRDFAAVADPFVAWIVQQKDTITGSKAELEDQLKYVNTRLASLAADGSKLADVNAINAKMEQAGITNNRHTTLSAKDVEVQWQQYQAFLGKKQKMLEEEIEHHKLRGVTPEQFAEIEGQFKSFDINGNGWIDKKELKACLYSLGEEKNRTEIEQIMKQYGTAGKGMPYSGFREFMIDILGVSDTKQDIINGFALINRGEKDVTKVEHMEMVMDTPDIDYIKQTSKADKGGYLYIPWTEQMFSR